jgi:hypothetical protein
MLITQVWSVAGSVHLPAEKNVVSWSKSKVADWNNWEPESNIDISSTNCGTHIKLVPAEAQARCSTPPHTCKLQACHGRRRL